MDLTGFSLKISYSSPLIKFRLNNGYLAKVMFNVNLKSCLNLAKINIYSRLTISLNLAKLALNPIICREKLRSVI